jgi:hypothetical protein
MTADEARPSVPGLAATGIGTHGGGQATLTLPNAFVLLLLFQPMDVLPPSYGAADCGFGWAGPKMSRWYQTG